MTDSNPLFALIPVPLDIEERLQSADAETRAEANFAVALGLDAMRWPVSPQPWATAAIELFEQLGNSERVRQCYELLYEWHDHHGRPNQSLEALDRAIAAVGEGGDPALACALHGYRASVLLKMFRTAEALMAAEEQVRCARQSANSFAIATALNLEAEVLRHIREPEVARSKSLEAMNLYEFIDNKWGMANSLVERAWNELALGNIDEARASLEAARAAGARLRTPYSPDTFEALQRAIDAASAAA